MKILKTTFLVTILSMAFVSCGKNKNIVKDINVDERIEQDKVYLDVEASLDLGNTMLMPMRFPVKIPKKGVIGEVEVGVDFVKATVLISELVKLQLQDSVLPNGGRLPFINTNKVVAIPLDKNGKSVLYISLVGQAKAVGITIAIKELDQLGTSQGYVEAFLPVTIHDFKIAAGVYASPKAGENGIGIFADLNPFFKMLSDQGRWFEEQDGDSQFKLDYSPIKISKSKLNAVNKYLYKLHQKSAVLNVVE